MRHVWALAAGGLLLAACGGDEGPGTVRLYDRAPVPAVPDRTAAIGVALVDGDYWAVLVGPREGEPPSLTFQLAQAFFADACLAVLDVDQCGDGYGVLAEPNRDLLVPTSDLAAVTVVAENRQNYAITGGELWSLADGAAASAPAPTEFTFRSYPFLLSVRGGIVVDARQIWVP